MLSLLIILSWFIVAMTGGMAIIFYVKLKKLEIQHALSKQQIIEQQQKIDIIQQQCLQSEKNSYKFIACASHDLRQPLHALSLYCNVLNRKKMQPDVKELSDNIQQSVNALVDLFNTLFDVSKLKTGSTTVKPRDVPLKSILQILDAEYKPQAQTKALQWHCDINDIIVHSDPVLLETILRNLISNALRYTKQGSISLFAKEHDGQIQISVSDTGIGIALQQQREIFNEFQQLKHASSGGTTGLGLGLSIVERLINILGHEIKVQSQVGQGSTFTLIVKKGNALISEGEHISPKTEKDLSGLHILVIDDDLHVRESMQTILQSWQCRVTLASTTAQAHTLILEQHLQPDAIISDYRLSKTETGVQLLQDLFKKTAALPSLIISSDKSDPIIEMVRKNGFLYLHKPVPPAKLRAFVHSIARKSAK